MAKFELEDMVVLNKDITIKSATTTLDVTLPKGTIGKVVEITRFIINDDRIGYKYLLDVETYGKIIINEPLIDEYIEQSSIEDRMSECEKQISDIRLILNVILSKIR